MECDVLHPNSEVYHHDNLCTCTKSSLTCTTFCKCKGSFQCKNPPTVSIMEAKRILADDAVLVWVDLQPSAFRCAISCSDTLPAYTRMFIIVLTRLSAESFIIYFIFYNMIFNFYFFITCVLLFLHRSHTFDSKLYNSWTGASNNVVVTVLMYVCK